MERSPSLDPALPPSAVLERLGPEVLRLVSTVQGLYDGRWSDCAEDLRRRSAGRPYLFRLESGLPSRDEELAWLQRLEAYETARGEPLPPATVR